MLTKIQLPPMQKTCPSEPLRWALVELVGYQQFTGRISDETLDGRQYVRLEVPETKVHKAFDCKFGIESVHKIIPITQEQAEGILKERERGRFALNFSQLVESGAYVTPDRVRKSHE